MWEPSGRCPAGHHNTPTLLVRVKEKGNLLRSSGIWQLKSEGRIINLPLDMLEGHLGIVTGVKISEIPKGESPDLAQIEKLSKVLERLKAFQF